MPGINDIELRLRENKKQQNFVKRLISLDSKLNSKFYNHNKISGYTDNKELFDKINRLFPDKYWKDILPVLQEQERELKRDINLFGIQIPFDESFYNELKQDVQTLRQQLDLGNKNNSLSTLQKKQLQEEYEDVLQQIDEQEKKEMKL
jgi:hypothetical protein